MEILGLGKKLFWELVPGVEVTHVSKFHSIWTIAQESSFEGKRRILGRKICSRDLPPDFVHWDVSARCLFTILAIFC
jgi:hypothetical protein